jgi:hypothetical protein
MSERRASNRNRQSQSHSARKQVAAQPKPKKPKTPAAGSLAAVEVDRSDTASFQAFSGWSEGHVPEFVRVLLQALHKFKIDATDRNTWPKHDEDLVPHFESVRLSNGRLISPSQAKYLATFVLPVDAMTGGRKTNKKG